MGGLCLLCLDHPRHQPACSALAFDSGSVAGQNVCRGCMHLDAPTLGHRCVDDVAHHLVVEGKDRLGRFARADELGVQQVGLVEPGQARLNLLAPSGGQECHERGAFTADPEDGGVLEHLPVRGGEQVQAGGHEGRDAPRKGDVGELTGELPAAGAPSEQAVVGQHPQGLLEEQRIAVRRRQQPAARPVRQCRAAQQVAQQLVRIRLRQRTEPQRGAPVTRRCPARPAGDELWTGRCQHEQREPLLARHSAGDEVEHGVTGPLHVVDGDDERQLPGHRAQQPLHRPGSVRGCRVRGCEAGQRDHAGHDCLAVGAGGQQPAERRRRLCTVGSGQRPHQASDRLEPAALAVGLAAHRPAGDLIRPPPGGVAHQSALAGARLPDEGDQLGAPRPGLLQCLVEHGPLGGAADERWCEAPRPAGLDGQHAADGPRNHPFRLALQRECISLPRVDRALDECVRGGRDQHLRRARRLLEAGCEVGDIARHQRGRRPVAGRHLPGRHSDAHQQAASVPLAQLAVEPAYRISDLGSRQPRVRRAAHRPRAGPARRTRPSPRLR